MAVHEIWPEHRGNEKSACYGAVMVYSTLDACPMGLFSSWPYTLLHLCPSPSLAAAPPSSLQWKPPQTPSLTDEERKLRAMKKDTEKKRAKEGGLIWKRCLLVTTETLPYSSIHRKHTQSIGCKYTVCINTFTHSCTSHNHKSSNACKLCTARMNTNIHRTGGAVWSPPLCLLQSGTVNTSCK